MREKKPREIAVKLLQARQRQSGFIEELLDDILRKEMLKPEDRRFLQELVFGTVRWQSTLDWLIRRKTWDKPQKPLIENLLRLALYQMFWLDRVPDYATVNETVEICKRLGSAGEAKFVNAVLRAYGRETEASRSLLEGLKRADPALGYSHPEWLVTRWEQRWGRSETLKLLDWNNAPPPPFARVNRLKTTAKQLLEMWANEGVQLEPVSLDWLPGETSFRFKAHPPLAHLPSFQQGLFYIQDPSTLLAVEMLGAEKGELILDLCSAPGGKTTYLAQKIDNRGKIVAEDIDPSRLRLVAENCARLGVTCVRTDSAALPADAAFDRILIDAPCSNSGVMRRRVELRWRISPSEIARLATVQRDLLKRAARRLRLGGTLVYSTCSLEREENDTVIREFLDANSHFRLETQRQLLPFKDAVDGAYVAKLVHS